MDKDYVIKHLKDLVRLAKKDLESYGEMGNSNLTNYKEGVIDGYEIAIDWLESQ